MAFNSLNWRHPVTKLPLIATMLLATTVAAAPAMAKTPFSAKEKTTFTQDGVTYYYSQTKVGGSLIIQGYAVDGPDFYYVVRDGRVVGKNDDRPVSFQVTEAVDQANGASVN